MFGVSKEDIEEYNRDMENYGKSILSHSDDYDTSYHYDSTIKHFNDEADGYPSYDDGESTIKHFQD